MTLKELEYEFSLLPKGFKTKDVDKLNKRLIKENKDVSFLKEIILDRQEFYRTYFQVEMGKLNNYKDQMTASEASYDLKETQNELGIFDLYYGEVMTGLQTQNFSPTLWVDISETHARKVKAYHCHQSQGIDEVQAYHDHMEILRGMECHAKYGEAFIKQNY